MSYVVVLVEREGITSNPPRVYVNPDGQPWAHRVLAEQARRRIHFDYTRKRSSMAAPVHTYVIGMRPEIEAEVRR